MYNVKDPLQKTKVQSPALAPGPVTFEPASAPGPALEPVSAPALEPVSAPAPAPALEPVSAPAPSVEQAIGSTIPSGPAPEPEFSESGEGYGLYGRGSYSQYSPTKETPSTATNFELLNEDFNDQSYKTGYPKTNFYNNNNNNNEEFRHNANYNEEFRNNVNNNEEFRNNVNNNEEFRINDNNNEEYRSTYSSGYASNFNDRFSNNNYDDKENYPKSNNYNGNGYEGKREGMSDTRFLENGKYYYNANTVNNENYNLNGYESERGSTAENEGYYEKSQYPNEFDTMEEYEKQQEEQGYTP